MSQTVNVYQRLLVGPEIYRADLMATYGNLKEKIREDERWNHDFWDNPIQSERFHDIWVTDGDHI